MAWTTMPVMIDGQVLTGAIMQIIKLNFDETAPAKISAAGQYVVGAGTNALAARQIQQASINTQQTTTSTSFTNLATVGPQVTVTSGTAALVWFGAQVSNSVTNAANQISYAISGATTYTPDGTIDEYIDGLAASNSVRASVVHWHTGLTAGSNTFTMKYLVGSGTGTFWDRVLGVMPF